MKPNLKKFLSIFACGLVVFCLLWVLEDGLNAAKKSDISEPSVSNAPASSSSKSSSSGKSSSGSSKKSSGSSKSSGSKSKSSGSDDSFEEYLKKNDPDSYEYYKDLQKGYDSGSYSKEYGFSSKSSGGSSKKSGSSKSKSSGSSDSFEDYLKKNDPDSYDYYKGLQKGYNSGSYSKEDGFYKK